MTTLTLNFTFTSRKPFALEKSSLPEFEKQTWKSRQEERTAHGCHHRRGLINRLIWLYSEIRLPLCLCGWTGFFCSLPRTERDRLEWDDKDRANQMKPRAFVWVAGWVDVCVCVCVCWTKCVLAAVYTLLLRRTGEVFSYGNTQRRKSYSSPKKTTVISGRHKGVGVKFHLHSTVDYLPKYLSAWGRSVKRFSSGFSWAHKWLPFQNFPIFN